ncbi:hypothetical protein GALL_473680 [mine drainage metagenome]|uniref:Uncharacterized protein n=1 Tax=mine drainage metagenome TaxID=410659 RepID=A0A1J5PIK3_9ZZZZ
MIICEVDGGKPRKLASSPPASAISRCASAKRVIESARNRTCAPASRKCSATVIAAQAQRRRVSGDWSEVAVTTTDRAIPSGPSTRSTNSRSSRPRSPISAITTTSASTPRANFAKSEDFPTPDPANSPTRCPRTIGSSVLKTATPVSSRSPSRRRAAAAGAATRSGRSLGPGNSGRPSSGRPNGSTIRPIQDASGAISLFPISVTLSPIDSPSGLSSGSTDTPSCPSRNTSPPMRCPSALSISTRSPRAATRVNPSTRSAPRPRSTTCPTRRTTLMLAISAKRASNPITVILMPP